MLQIASKIAFRATDLPTYTYINTHTYIHACMHACRHTYIRTYIHACMQTYIHRIASHPPWTASAPPHALTYRPTTRTYRTKKNKNASYAKQEAPTVWRGPHKGASPERPPGPVGPRARRFTKMRAAGPVLAPRPSWARAGGMTRVGVTATGVNAAATVLRIVH